MTVEEVKTYRVTCDWHDTEGGQCPAIVPEMSAVALSGLHLDLRNRGWVAVPTENHFDPMFKYYCAWHHSQGKPYKPMSPEHRVPHTTPIPEIPCPPQGTGSEFHDAVNEERL